MTDETQVATTEAEPVFPKVRDAFYIIACDKPNGAIDISSEGHDALTLDTAIEKATDNVREYGDTWFVIECRAIRKVVDRKPSVLKIGPRQR